MSSIPVWTPSQLFSASKVGHAIISARSLCPDPCSLLYPPGSSSFSLATSSGSLPAGTWYVALTWSNEWGETTAYEQSITLSGTGGIVVSIPNIPPKATANLYWGPYSQNETNVQTGITATSYTITEPVQGYQPLPLDNSAWLPDTNGQLIDAASFYRWINEGLDEMCRMTGGILDRAGLPTTVGMGQVELPVYWTKITNVWYDGWPVVLDYRKNMFYYNAIPGIPSICTMNRIAGRLIMEMWPQALRTANSTTLSAALGTTDTTINVVNSNPTSDTNVVNIGCVMISDPSQNRFPEWCYFNNQTPTSYTNITRGVGGSRPQAWNVGTPVFEGNFMFAGYRLATHYFPGDSGHVLDCPPEWESLLTDFLLYRFSQAIQRPQEAAQHKQDFMSKAEALSQQKQIMRRNRLPRFDTGPPGTYPLGPFGSVIVP